MCSARRASFHRRAVYLVMARCIRIPGGFLTLGGPDVAIEHNGRQYHFEWTESSGWVPVNQDGSERRSRVPNAVWEKLSAVQRPRGS